MERLDKVVSNYTSFSRREVKDLIKKKRIKVNDIFAARPEQKVDEEKDVIKIDEDILTIKKYVYIVMNKPKGYITATRDNNQETVIDLLDEDYLIYDIFPVGRLDKDTTGLLILTNDGTFSHEIVSPRKDHIKVYEADIDKDITDKMIKGFENGVKLEDGTLCKSAKLEIIESRKAKVTITEGKYHQVKRMFEAFDSSVLELKRIQIGSFCLPDDIEEGDYRELTDEEIELIKN